MIENLTPEIVTAISVSLGALLGGTAALIGEFRKPSSARERAEKAEAEAHDRDETVAAMAEEAGHLSRTMWVIERRLSDRLQRIELLLTPHTDVTPPRLATEQD